MPPTLSNLDALQATWEAAWPQALEAWSRFTRLRPPMLCVNAADAQREGLTGSFAMIRLADQAVVVSLPEVVACGVEAFAREVLAHEIGHHVLAPATLTDHARMIARMRWALPTIENQAPMVANLYTDLLINDRLQRGSGLRMADVYRAIAAKRGMLQSGGAVWTLYLRIYELLWMLPRNSLGGGFTNDRLEGDAWLGARLVRSYARDALGGSGRFAALLMPHLLDDRNSQPFIDKLLDTRNAGVGGEPAGLSEFDPDERDGAIHPALDRSLMDDDEEEEKPKEQEAQSAPVESSVATQQASGQTREPFQYGEILRASGLEISDHEAAIRYYRERALPYLVPFLSRELPRGCDPLPEGLEPWDIGQSLECVDWLESVLQSPRVIPGLTTVQRIWGTSESPVPRREPLDLDLYVDSSGSMANPQQRVSYPALAGAIICLSALRAGASVQATLWSGARQFTMTPGFVRDEHNILGVLTGYFGGGTAFPIHVLRDTYEKRRAGARPVHILVISDDGVTTMWDKDERGSSGWDVSANSLRKAGGGGTLVLNLARNWETFANRKPYAEIKRGRDEQGWNVSVVAGWQDLVEFAREFSRLRYGSSPQRPKVEEPNGI